MATGYVLVVEDDSDMRAALAEILEQEGHRVVTAGDGLDALEVVGAEGRPQIVLLDLMMPVVDGWEFLRRMRAQPTLANVPVLVVSAMARPPSDGRTYFVGKPIGLDRLLDLVRTVNEHAATAPS